MIYRLTRLVIGAVLALSGCHCHAFTAPVATSSVVVRELSPVVVVERTERVERQPVRLVYKTPAKPSKHRRPVWSEIGKRRTPRAWSERDAHKAFPIEHRISARGSR